jgi:di/tricarboxylate transporter
MTTDAWVTLAVLTIMLVSLIRSIVPPAVAILGSVIALFLVDVIDATEAFAGFSNPAPLTIAALYILAGAAARTSGIRRLIDRALPGDVPDRTALARLLPPVLFSSAILNNTPIVAVLAPELVSWGKRRGRAVSSLLMPVSFAAILGGVVTLIGTSTTLVVSGLLQEAGNEPLSFFEVTPIGLPLALVGLGAVLILAPSVLPTRTSALDISPEAMREFVIDMNVDVAGPLDGTTVERGGLRNLAGVFLVQVHRGDKLVEPVSPELVLEGGDRLRFVGRADDVLDLHAMGGLTSAESEQFSGFDLSRSAFVEVVVGNTSPLVGRTLKEARFRSTYQGAVVAIHRAGQRIHGKLGDVPVRTADTLIVLSDPGFRERWRDRRDFLLIAEISESPPAAPTSSLVPVLVLGVVVVLAATGLLTILKAAMLGVLVVLGLRLVSVSRARDSIDLDVVLVVAGGFGLAAAMDNSGLAASAARAVDSYLGNVGPLAVLIGLVALTVVLTEVVSNTAAAVMVYPVAVSTAVALGADPRSFAIAIAIAASASFLTPVGYQTNTMVYGPGGYRYGDYARLGAPLTAIVVIGVPLLTSVTRGL